MANLVDKVNQDPAAVADEVFEAVHSVMHLFRARQYRGLRDGAHEMTHLEAKVLGFFARHPQATQGELVAHSGRDKGQIARLIGGLRERGLLDAEPDPADRRSVRLQLSADGRELQRVLHRQARRVSARAVDGLSDAERRQLLTLLERVKANLEGAG